MTCFADDGSFSASMISTAGVDCRVKALSLNGQRVSVQIWDTAGQERFKTITRQSLTPTHLHTHPLANCRCSTRSGLLSVGAVPVCPSGRPSVGVSW